MDHSILDLIEYSLKSISDLKYDLADIRIEKIRFTRIEVKDSVVRVSSGLDYGAAVRVFVNGSMGFAYTTLLEKNSIVNALRNAYSMARATHGEFPKPYLLEPLKKLEKHSVKRSIVDVPIDVKLSDIRDLDEMVAKEVLIKSHTINYLERLEEKYYGSSEGRYLAEKRELVYTALLVYGEEAGVRASSFITEGTIKGYSIWDKRSQESFYRDATRKLKNQLTGKTPKAGIYPVVLGPKAVGVFVHEAFGHLAEADLVVGGSALQGKRGVKVASELVTIIDAPDVDDGFGTFSFDDEGVEASRATIVENGVHVGVMNSRVYASLMGDKPTGNGRAESFRHPPIVRMRNTILLPRDHSFEELLEGIDFGYYIVSTAGGQTNLDGSFQVGIEEAYEIVNGEIGSPVRNLGITGNTLETLKNIDAVGKDFKLGYGRCGKEQLAFVSEGGPHVRVKRISVGGRA